MSGELTNSGAIAIGAILMWEPAGSVCAAILGHSIASGLAAGKPRGPNVVYCAVDRSILARMRYANTTTELGGVAPSLRHDLYRAAGAFVRGLDLFPHANTLV